MMRIPHILDFYFGDDDSILQTKTKLCVIEKTEFIR